MKTKAQIHLIRAGLALAAIQGLSQKLTEELRRRAAENAELKLRLAALETIILNLRSP